MKVFATVLGWISGWRMPHADKIPPGKVKDLHIASCRYDTPTNSQAGFGPEDW